MTETTEEKDPIEKAKAHICGLPGFSEYCDYLRSRKGQNRLIYDLNAQVEELKEKLSLYEWRDISSLPKDGKIYALINGNCLTSGRFDVETGEIFSHCYKTVTATHWREVDPVDIYTPPSTQEGEE